MFFLEELDMHSDERDVYESLRSACFWGCEIMSDKIPMSLTGAKATAAADRSPGEVLEKDD